MSPENGTAPLAGNEGGGVQLTGPGGTKVEDRATEAARHPGLERLFDPDAVPPAQLRALGWVAWKYWWSPGKAKPQKVPIDPRTESACDYMNPATWVSYEEAREYALRRGIGIGCVLDGSGVGLIDFDATDSAAASANQRAVADAAVGLYSEVSPSGKGRHILAVFDREATRTKELAGVEVYTHRRWSTWTGFDASGEVGPLPALAQSILAPYFAPKPEMPTCTNAAPLDASDEEVLARVRERFGERHAALWGGTWSYGEGDNSQSRADCELMAQLAEFTGDDAQVLRLFCASGLADTLDRKRGHESAYLMRTLAAARGQVARSVGSAEEGKQIALTLLEGWKGKQAKEAAGLLVRWEDFKPKGSTLKLVKGVLGQGGLSVLYGPPGSGKTFLALDLAFAVATGRPWMGHGTRQGTVVYAAGEGQAGLRNRRTAVSLHHRVESPPVAFLPHALSTPDEGEKLALAMEEAGRMFGAPPALLIVDTLNRFFGDDREENSAKDMKAFIGALDSLKAKLPDLHILIVHHSGKDQERGMRGSSALKGAADTVIDCSKADNERYVAKVEKQKDGKEGLFFPFILQPVALGDDADGESMDSCVVVHDPVGSAQPQVTGRAATVIRVLLALKATVQANKLGYAEIPLVAVYNFLYRERPDDKQDTIRKLVREGVNTLVERKLVEFAEVSGVDGVRFTPVLSGIPYSEEVKRGRRSPPENAGM